MHRSSAAQDAGQVEVLLDTQQPYQHCLEIPAGAADAGQPIRVEVEGLVFRHYSKSVANNYCVFAQVRQGSRISGTAAAAAAAWGDMSSCGTYFAQRRI